MGTLTLPRSSASERKVQYLTGGLLGESCEPSGEGEQVVAETGDAGGGQWRHGLGRVYTERFGQ